MKTYKRLVISCLSLIFCSAVSAFDLPGSIPGIPGGNMDSGGVDINSVFDTYIQSYCGMLAGQASVAGALGLTEEQQKLVGEAERLKKNNGEKIDAAEKIDSEAQKKIDEKMTTVDKLNPEKTKLVVEGTAAYAVGTMKLVELVGQIKNIKKPGFTDFTAIGKFKVLLTLPNYILNIATVLPNYMKFMNKIGAEPDPSFKQGISSLPKP
jgi:hypothetical protein